MAAHHQTYVFQVEIHKLWGILLAGGSAFRFLTYFFLWLRPPTESVLPSRPPTEVLTSFGYAAGGIVFMLSNEEIAFAAMRAGWDDMMAFLNFTIALTSLIFCWTVVVMAFKGWAVMRLQRGQADEERS
jgi:cytochrome b561